MLTIILAMLLGAARLLPATNLSFESNGEGTSRALIIVGLPGDPAHDQLFRSTADRWRDTLVSSLGFPPSNIQILSACAVEPGSDRLSASRDSIERAVTAIRAAITSEDRLWVFVLGHANLDDGRAWLHLPGPDIASDQFAALFDQISAREQVFWMTTAASGAFVKPLSRANRVVIAATGPDGESNETEFPHALSDVLRQTPVKLDRNQDGTVSLLELFEATNQSILLRFQADRRAPTEHARLDDDGDGVGSESPSTGKAGKTDGTLASKIIVLGPGVKPASNPSPRSENGTKSAVLPAR